MQEITSQGVAPPLMTPVARAFGAKAFGAKPFAAPGKLEPAKPEPLSDHDRFHLEILAQEDSSLEIPPDSQSAGAPSTFFGADGLTFGDVLDIINPLQHIPVVSTLYRELSGDEISPGARMAGGALFGGPIGFALASVNNIVEMTTGSDIGESVVAAFTGDGEESETAALPAKTGAATHPATQYDVSLKRPAQTKAPQIASSGAPTAPATPPTNNPRMAAEAAPGSLMNLYKSTTPSRAMTPTEALIQARAAVPMAGPIKGLGNSSRSRFQVTRFQATPFQAAQLQPPGAPSSAQTRATPTSPPPTSAPNIGARLSSQLTLLAAQSQAGSSVPEVGKAAPAKDIQAKTPGKQSPNPSAGIHGATPPAPLPAAQIPTAMRDALDRYEQMKRQQLSPG